MTKTHILSAAALAVALSGLAAPRAALAESTAAPAAEPLPAACIAAAEGGLHHGMPGAMGMPEMPMAPDAAGAETMAAMTAMHAPMMQAAMIPDPDLAFNCGMIAHHRGAIAMAEIELKRGRDAASKAMAEAIIAAQKQEIATMIARVEALAKTK